MTTPDANQPRRRESREELIARVAQEQAGLHPAPVYTARSKRRLLHFLYAIVPISFALGALGGWAFGWSPLEWVGASVGLILALSYLGYVALTERDDGHVARETMRLHEERQRRHDEASDPDDPPRT